MTDGSRELHLFLEMLITEQAASPHTVLAYKHDITQLLRYAKRPVAHIDAAILREYICHLKHLSAYTVRRFISSHRRFFTFLVDEGLVNSNPMEGILLPKLEKLLPRILYEEEVCRLLDAAYTVSSPQSLRNATIIEVLYATGMRVSELVFLKKSDVMLEKSLVKVLGKRARERFVLLHAKACETLYRYMETLPEGVWLFPSPRQPAKPLTRQMVFLLLKTTAVMADIDPDLLSPHVLRHAFATHLLERGADIFSVQALLGHKSIVSTQVYTHVLPETARAFLERYHPFARHQEKFSRTQ